MSDNIEVAEVDGVEVAAFVSLREPAWHTLGTVLEEELDTEGMLKAGYLHNWNVRVEEVEIPEGYSTHRTQYRTVRDNPFDGGPDILGYVGERYVPFQNEQLFSFGDALLDGGRWETAGSIKHGTRVFGSLALNRESTIGEDKIDNYLLVTTSHDGTSSITAAVTPVRVVCSNTLTVGLSSAKQTFKIRHTQSVQGRVQAAREALALTDVYLDAWEEQMWQLLDKTVTDIQFEELVNTIYNPKDTKAGVTRFEKRRDILLDIWTGDTIGDLRGTGYGAYNALNEELMWYRIGRGENAEENINVSRSGFNPVWNAENNALFKAVMDIPEVDVQLVMV